jgi:two-component sensor histidine kinase
MPRWSNLQAHRLGTVSSVAIGAVCAAAAIGFRSALTPFLGGEEHISAMFPALLVATFFGGLTGGSLCLALSVAGDWYLFLGPPRSFALAPHEGAGLMAILMSGGLLVAGMVAIRELLTDLSEAHASERTLARELQHRVKNNLAVIEALAVQSARGTSEPEVWLDRFLGRMKSLSAAQVLLSGSESGSAPIGQVVEATLQPFVFADRISWRGQALEVDPQQAVALALCLHELTTNAIKYGSLSTPLGSVRIEWSRGEAGLANIRWEETGGPPSMEPKRVGSGLRLLRRGLESLRPASVSFGPGGVRWDAEFHVVR